LLGNSRISPSDINRLLVCRSGRHYCRILAERRGGQAELGTAKCGQGPLPPALGGSRALKQLLSTADPVAPHDLPVTTPAMP
jgi:hypothetical protein